MKPSGLRTANLGISRERRARGACASFRNPQSTVRSRCAFTLLEVILALGVLAAAIAVVGEVTRLSHRNAQAAALEGEAVVIAESVMSQVLAGLMEPATIPPTPWSVGDAEPSWRYALQVEPTDRPGLLSARVTIEEITQAAKPITVELTRWVLDPDAIDSGGGAN